MDNQQASRVLTASNPFDFKVVLGGQKVAIGFLRCSFHSDMGSFTWDSVASPHPICPVKWQKTEGNHSIPLYFHWIPFNKSIHIHFKQFNIFIRPFSSRGRFFWSPSTGTRRSASVWPSSPFCGCHVWPTPEALRPVTSRRGFTNHGTEIQAVEYCVCVYVYIYICIYTYRYTVTINYMYIPETMCVIYTCTWTYFHDKYIYIYTYIYMYIYIYTNTYIHT